MKTKNTKQEKHTRTTAEDIDESYPEITKIDVQRYNLKWLCIYVRVVGSNLWYLKLKWWRWNINMAIIDEVPER